MLLSLIDGVDLDQRGLAHPSRLRLLGELRLRGPQTVGMLSEIIHEAVGSVSYHLGTLASHGLVEEVPELARDRRERWWRAAHARTTWEPLEALDDPERKAASDSLRRAILRRYLAVLESYLDAEASLPPQWVRGTASSDTSLYLTSDELVELRDDLEALAATFAGSAALVAIVVPRSPRSRDTTGKAVGAADSADGTPESGGVDRHGYWREFGAGARFLAREPLLRAVVALVLVTNLFDAAKSTVLLPVVAHRQLGGAAAFGILVGVMGGGALAGSVIFSVVGHRLPRRASFVAAFAVAGAPPFLGLAAGLPLPLLSAVFAVSGLAAGAINPIIGTIKLERVPPGMRARVYGVMGAACWAAMPLGSLGAGYASSRLGTTATLVAVGSCYLVVTLIPLLGGPWRVMGGPGGLTHSGRPSQRSA